MHWLEFYKKKSKNHANPNPKSQIGDNQQVAALRRLRAPPCVACDLMSGGFWCAAACGLGIGIGHQPAGIGIGQRADLPAALLTPPPPLPYPARAGFL
jgi:hypothetical protein